MVLNNQESLICHKIKIKTKQPNFDIFLNIVSQFLSSTLLTFLIRNFFLVLERSVDQIKWAQSTLLIPNWGLDVQSCTPNDRHIYD